ncbi:UNVERIFIED_CONTAM: BAG family molecular chaperone regulator 4 [Sesamum radiatum]|uniref:BAG family molecular chaperone regulator 4 n=1 Tax=Sesamum radiatum TaxID=300843 RepID=A0AAW2NLT6_SESRA
MKSLNPSHENCRRRNGVIGLGLVPAQVPATMNIRVSHGLNQYEVAVPSNSTFGYLKSVIAQKFGLKPEMYELFFRGNEAVAEVRKEVDKLKQQVLALQAVVDSGKKVDGKEIIYLTEMLMRQLLKLDGIETEGEGRVQRKMEVRRVQSLVDTLDVLKSRNSNASNNMHKTVSSTTQREAFNPDCGSVRSVTSPWETFDPHGSLSPSFAMPSSALSPTPYVAHSTVPYYVPYPMPSSTPSAYAPIRLCSLPSYAILCSFPYAIFFRSVSTKSSVIPIESCPCDILNAVASDILWISLNKSPYRVITQFHCAQQIISTNQWKEVDTNECSAK